MSVADIYQDMYLDVCKELDATRRRLLDEIHAERMRVIQLEGQRLMLLSHINNCAKAMKTTHPSTAAYMAQFADQLRNSYEAAPSKVAVLPTCEARCVDESVHGHARSADNASLYTQAGTDPRGAF
jgi:hypothetical protein